LAYLQKIEWLRQRLTEPLPGHLAQEKMAARVVPMPLTIPQDARPSAVLCLLFPVDADLHVLLMKRTPDKSAHSGQVSFPGGSQDPSDVDLKSTALRETYEEIGISPSNIDVLGALTPLYIPVSKFHVFPYLGFINEINAYNISHSEVAHVIELSLNNLFHPDRKTMVDVVSPAMPQVIRNVKAYKLEDGTIIWGATAMMLSELETILEEYPTTHFQ